MRIALLAPIWERVPPPAYGGIELVAIRVDEQRHADAGIAELAAGIAERRFLTGHVESALGSDFLAFLGHETAIRRTRLERDADHLIAGRHLEIEACLQRFGTGLHVPVLDVTTVFAQVNRDAVGARLLGDQRRV